MFVSWKIERYPFSIVDSTWSTTGEVLTSFYDPAVRVNLGDARDSFDFKVTNFSDDFSNYFQPNDKLILSRVVNSTALASSDIIMVGTVQNVPEQVTGTMNQIRVEGYNFSEAVLSAIALFDPTGLPIDEAIQQALNAVRVYNENFEVTWHPSNPTTTTEGDPFPDVTERWVNKSVNQFIQKYSTSDKTLDVDYYWYVDKDNKFVWRPRTQTTTDTFNSATDEFSLLKISKDIKDVKNFVIIKGGIDPKGVGIQDRVQDDESIGKHGLRPYILVNIAKNAETLVTADVGTNGVTQASDITFPFTPPWNDGVSVANYDAYVEALREYVKAQCRSEGEAFLTLRKYGKLKVELEFEAGKGWVLGDLISCTIPSLGSAAKSLRVSDAQFMTETDLYTLVEDIGSI